MTAPTPDPLVITLPAGSTGPVSATDEPIASWLASASATDAEDPAATVSNDAPAEFPIGTTVVSFTATDSCGLTTTVTASVTIEVQGNTTPVVTAPDPLTVDAPLCGTSVPATDKPIASWLASATATDTEDGGLPVSNDAPVDFPIGTTTVTFSATDSANATGAATSTATVNDTNTAPVVNAPAPLGLTVPAGTTSVAATDPQIAAWLASASASDAEDGTLSVSNDAPADFPIGTTTVTFSATDNCGVTTTATSSVTVQLEAGGADVFLTRLQVPDRVNARTGRTVSRIITVRGDGDTITQDATVVLSVAAPAGVEAVVTPDAVTESVSPGRRTTRFRFRSDIICMAPVAGVVTWTATINAAQNGDPGNDTLEGTTQVRCGGGRADDDDDDHEDDGD